MAALYHLSTYFFCKSTRIFNVHPLHSLIFYPVKYNTLATRGKAIAYLLTIDDVRFLMFNFVVMPGSRGKSKISIRTSSIVHQKKAVKMARRSIDKCSLLGIWPDKHKWVTQIPHCVRNDTAVWLHQRCLAKSPTNAQATCPPERSERSGRIAPNDKSPGCRLATEGFDLSKPGSKRLVINLYWPLSAISSLIYSSGSSCALHFPWRC